MFWRLSRERCRFALDEGGTRVVAGVIIKLRTSLEWMEKVQV